MPPYSGTLPALPSSFVAHLIVSCISLRFESQHGHDDWVHAIVFHPNGQYMLTAADDHTIRIWDLKTGRCTRKIEAHVQFVTSMSWGRQVVGTAPQGTDKTDPNAGPRLVNVIATTGSDQVSLLVAIAESQRTRLIYYFSSLQSVKIWVPMR